MERPKKTRENRESSLENDVGLITQLCFVSVTVIENMLHLFQVNRLLLILHLGHVSYQIFSHKLRLSPTQYGHTVQSCGLKPHPLYFILPRLSPPVQPHNVESWPPQTPSISFHFAQVVPGPAQPYSAESPAKTPSISCYLVSALIYVVDSTDPPERLTQSYNELAKLLQEKELKDASLLIFANKQVWCRQCY